MHPNRREVFAEIPADTPCSVEFVVNGSATAVKVTFGAEEINFGVSDVAGDADDGRHGGPVDV